MQNKEITIYELMGLIKDGQAPKKIKLCESNNIYKFNKDYSSIEELYLTNIGNRWLDFLDITLDTKVEILPEENDEWEDIEEIETLEENIKYTKNSVTHIIGIDDKEKDVYIPILNQLIKNQRKIIEKLDDNTCIRDKAELELFINERINKKMNKDIGVNNKL